MSDAWLDEVCAKCGRLNGHCAVSLRREIERLKRGLSAVIHWNNWGSHADLEVRHIANVFLVGGDINVDARAHSAN